ncbi:MAG: hypothetical protein FJ298_15600, partial [Planctomycetes bacterium]|nr:hypothetical protein [Planctomycetota bacterium]
MFKLHLAARWLAARLALAAVLGSAPARPLCADPRQDARAAQTEAELALERHDLDRRRRRGDRAALAEIAEWAAEEPRDARLAVLHGLALSDAGRWKEAREAAERACASA